MTRHDPIHPERHKQLFLDDHAVESAAGVTRTLHQPEKQGAVLRGDVSAGQTGVQSRSSPQWNSDRQVWEWWYWAFYDAPNATGDRLDYYAVSKDGIEWEKPSLGLYEGRGPGDRNVAWDPTARSIYHVIRDEGAADPRRRYKGLFDLLDRRIGFSPDGFDWTLPDISPVPSQDESHCVYDESTGRYLATVKQATDWGRSVFLSTSENFTDWSFPTLVFNTDEQDNENRKRRIREATEDPDYLTPPVIGEPPEDYIAQCYQMAVMPYEGLYVGFPALYNPAGPDGAGNNTGLNQIELTVSRDMRTWDRVADRELFIGIDPWDGVNYGTAQNLMSGCPHVRGDEIWVYYNALRFRAYSDQHPELDPAFFKDGSALCLAKLRLDGFVSLDAAGGGSVVTKPFLFTGAGLSVNVEARGELRAELLDPRTGEPMPGFTAGECSPLAGDLLSGPIRWGERARPETDAQAQVRFHLRDASLYAFWTP